MEKQMFENYLKVLKVKNIIDGKSTTLVENFF